LVCILPAGQAKRPPPPVVSGQVFLNCVSALLVDADRPSSSDLLSPSFCFPLPPERLPPSALWKSRTPRSSLLFYERYELPAPSTFFFLSGSPRGFCFPLFSLSVPSSLRHGIPCVHFFADSWVLFDDGRRRQEGLPLKSYSRGTGSHPIRRMLLSPFTTIFVLLPFPMTPLGKLFHGNWYRLSSFLALRGQTSKLTFFMSQQRFLFFFRTVPISLLFQHAPPPASYRVLMICLSAR